MDPMQILKGGLAFIFILGAAVVIHEFGHFIVAKLLKIRVETFSVGFGPRLFGIKWGTTDYRLSAIPLGGYVKLGGDESNSPIEGEGASDIPREEQFSLRPRYQRIMVAVAGPVMNVLTALAIPFASALWLGVPVMPAPIVSHLVAGGDAEVAGIKPGDRIVAFDGQENPSWDEITGDALLSPDRPLPIEVERNGQRISLSIKPTKVNSDGHDIGRLDLEPDFGASPIAIQSVVPNSPAEQAGLKPGDRIISLNGEPPTSRDQVTEYIQEHKSEPIKLLVDRNGARQEITATVKRLDTGEEKLGVYLGYAKGAGERLGPSAAVSYSVGANVEILRLTVKALGQAFTGQRSIRDTLSGPIGIAAESSKAANEYGWEGVFLMLQFMSLNLGIFNLLPIPVLDGGAIFILLIEAVLGVLGLSISQLIRDRIQQVGLVALLLLMVFVITNDVLRLTSGLRSKGDKKPAAATPAAQPK
jgi:regulator of sigma E protease